MNSPILEDIFDKNLSHEPHVGASKDALVWRREACDISNITLILI